MSAVVHWNANELGIDGMDGDTRLNVAQPPVTARILERLAFIMATAEEVSVIVDGPGASEDEVREVTDVLVSVYAHADDVMRRLSH
jgi:hypothetical protein